MEGVLLIDKPKGPSSFQVIKQIRFLSGIRKVGHAGTLDPLASGLMIVCLGRYTKFMPLFIDSNKTYDTVFRLGESTTTDDGEGDIINRCSVDHLKISNIKQALGLFHGIIQQIPPKFSAVKVNGKRAYKLARTNQNVDLSTRSTEVFDIAIQNYEQPELSMRIYCAKGTYVRAIARDLGTVLKVGAYAKEIRRISSGGFTLKNAINLEDLNKNNIVDNLLVGEKALLGIAKVYINKTDKENLIYGRNSIEVSLPSAFAVAFYEENPIAILKKSSTGIKIARVV